MTDTTATLRQKIGRAQDLQSVVRTMKGLAASSVGQYERSVSALSDYRRAVEMGLSACFRHSESGAPIVDDKARPGAVGAVVFGSDQGLVGQFNEVVAEHAVKTLGMLLGRPRIWAVGGRVHARLADAGLALLKVFSVPSSVNAIARLVGRILLESEVPEGNGEVGELYLFYNRPSGGAAYAPVCQRLLPLDGGWRRERSELRWPTKNLPEVMGDPAATLGALIREYLFISLFRACAESLASENASRLAAMQRAEKNIEERLASLHDTFHRLRQSTIDEELFDLVSGFEALSKREGRRS